MIKDKPVATALLAEVAEVLAQCGRLRCVPTVDNDSKTVTLTLSVPIATVEDLELYERLRRVQDIAQLRAMAFRYGIPSETLAPFVVQITGDD